MKNHSLLSSCIVCGSFLKSESSVQSFMGRKFFMPIKGVSFRVACADHKLKTPVLSLSGTSTLK